MKNMHKEYRIVGKWGQWGDIVTRREHLDGDLEYIAEHYKGDLVEQDFRVEERDVSEWVHTTS